MPIPRADLLADVAAEDPVAHAWPQIQGDGSLAFYRERTDAPRRVEHARLGQRSGRAGVEAGGAGAAVVGLQRRVGRQHDVGEEGREQEVAAGLRIDEHRVLAEPAETGSPGEVALRDRRGIDHAPRAAARHAGLEPRREVVDPRPQEVVVVVAPGIPGHPALPRQAAPRIGKRGMVGGEHHHARGAVEEGHGRPPQRLVTIQPLPQRAGQPPGEPATKGLVVGWLDERGDADPREPEPQGLRAELGGDQGWIGGVRRG